MKRHLIEPLQNLHKWRNRVWDRLIPSENRKYNKKNDSKVLHRAFKFVSALPFGATSFVCVCAINVTLNTNMHLKYRSLPILYCKIVYVLSLYCRTFLCCRINNRHVKQWLSLQIDDIASSIALLFIDIKLDISTVT